MNDTKIRSYRITVAYDGTAYAGWQIQPNGLTVQEVLEREFSAILSASVKVHGSGRTDQGVHARGQVAHVKIKSGMNAVQLRRAMNSRLPDDIRILAVRGVAGDFHARKSALSKEYRYFIWNSEIVPPCERLYVAHVRNPLDINAMQRAADILSGEHDFASFMANPNRHVPSTVRTVFSFNLKKHGHKITISVVGSGFLYKMVRGLAGWLIRVGSGAADAESTSDLLTGAKRTANVPTAPGRGLFLWKVTY